MARITIFVTEDWHFCTHRLPLAIAAKKAGHDVTVITRVRNHGDIIRRHGINLVPLQLSRSGKNPLRELAVVGRLIGLYRRLRPDVVHHVALKPVLYGSIAARISGVPCVVNAIPGMGYAYTSNSQLAKVMRTVIELLWRLLLGGRKARVIVQNPDDLKLLLDSKIVAAEKIVLIRGSGVDTNHYVPSPEPSDTPLVVLPARLLWDKGVREFVGAARTLKAKGIVVRFALVGEPDSENPGAVPVEQIKKWQQEGVVEWWGLEDDMQMVYRKANIVCLPSYREGLPKCLLEASASGRAIVTTDAPGCREIVTHEKNGLLVPVGDEVSLSAALERLINNPMLRLSMGAHGRKIVLAEYGIEKVVTQTLCVYQELLVS